MPSKLQSNPSKKPWLLPHSLTVSGRRCSHLSREGRRAQETGKLRPGRLVRVRYLGNRRRDLSLTGRRACDLLILAHQKNTRPLELANCQRLALTFGTPNLNHLGTARTSLPPRACTSPKTQHKQVRESGTFDERCHSSGSSTSLGPADWRKERPHGPCFRCACAWRRSRCASKTDA